MTPEVTEPPHVVEYECGIVDEEPFSEGLKRQRHWDIRDTRPLETLSGDFIQPPPHARASTLKAARKYAAPYHSITEKSAQETFDEF